MVGSKYLSLREKPKLCGLYKAGTNNFANPEPPLTRVNTYIHMAANKYIILRFQPELLLD